MTDTLELLSPDLLRDHAELAGQVRAFCTRMQKPLGWHYVLDYIWVLRQLEQHPGVRVVLDAGAGNGAFQALLAHGGRAVLSVDFSRRIPPHQYVDLCRVALARDDVREQGEYAGYIARNYGQSGQPVRQIPFLADADPCAVLAAGEADLVYYQADLAHMPLLPDAGVDAVVSISALEHNDPRDLPRVLAELRRVLKPGAPMLVTVSAAREADWFHEQSKGWCFTEATLAKLFGLGDFQSNFGEYERIMARMREGGELKEHLAPFYFQSGDNGMPWGRWDPRYLPVGVACRKER